MRNSNNVVLGGVLVAIGALWLFRSMGYFDFYWSDLFNYWYVFLIVAGVLLVVSGTTHNRLASSLAGIFITFSIVGGVAKGSHREFRNFSPFEWHSKKDRAAARERKRQGIEKAPKGEVVRGDFGYDMRPDLKEAKLNFSGGAGVFTIGGKTGRLFEAHTSSTFVNYLSNIKHNTVENFATVDFNMEKADFSFDEDNDDNTVNIQLNDTVKWDIELKFGAGEGTFDFSQNMVEKLDIKSGAADIKLKLGDKAAQSDVAIKAGMANIEINVPKSVAVEIDAKAALSATDFPGFEKISKNIYRSPNYDYTGKKIKLKYNGGLSNLKIERY
jgi:hypothetical protein